MNLNHRAKLATDAYVRQPSGDNHSRPNEDRPRLPLLVVCKLRPARSGSGYESTIIVAKHRISVRIRARQDLSDAQCISGPFGLINPLGSREEEGTSFRQVEGLRPIALTSLVLSKPVEGESLPISHLGQSVINSNVIKIAVQGTPRTRQDLLVTTAAIRLATPTASFLTSDSQTLMTSQSRLTSSSVTSLSRCMLYSIFRTQ